MSALTVLVQPAPCARCGRIIDTTWRVSYVIALDGNHMELTHEACPRDLPPRITTRGQRLVLIGSVLLTVVWVWGLIEGARWVTAWLSR